MACYCSSTDVLTMRGVVGLLLLDLNQTDKMAYEHLIRSVLVVIGVGVGVGVHHQLDHLSGKHLGETILEALCPSVVGRGHVVDTVACR